MEFFENELLFTEQLSLNDHQIKGLFTESTLKEYANTTNSPTELLGINIRLGSKPIVLNLSKLMRMGGDALHPIIESLFEEKDCYLIVHAIGAIRTQGKARIDELQYFAEADNAEIVQTTDLIPNTRFKKVFEANATIEGSLTANGQAMIDIPDELTKALIPQYMSIGGNMQLQLSTEANFVGKFIYNIQLPIIQSSGIASHTCSWVLNPDENKTPLLGDQLLVQSIAVPKGTPNITYNMHGVVKVDRGIFWKQQQKKTPVHQVVVNLIN